MIDDAMFLKHFNHECYEEMETIVPPSTGLEEYKKWSEVSADTAEYSSVLPYYPTSITLNPTLLLKAVTEEKEYMDALAGLARKGAQYPADEEIRVQRVLDDMLVFWTIKSLEAVPGHVSVQIDPRLETSSEMVASVLRLVALLEEEGAPRARVFFKIPLTTEGIRAIRELEGAGIGCNGTLCFSLKQAVQAANAGAAYVSPYVGRVDQFWRATENWRYTSREDLGVALVNRILSYFQQHQYRTKVIAASIHSPAQALALCGCDVVTLAVPQLAALETLPGYQVHARANRTLFVLSMELHGPELPFDARVLLDDGLKRFVADFDALEALVTQLLHSKDLSGEP